MFKRLLPWEKMRWFTLFSLAVSGLAYCLNAVFYLFGWTELYAVTIVLVASADTFLLIVFNVIHVAKDALKKFTKMRTVIFLSTVLLSVSVFLFFAGLTIFSVMLSLCVVVPIVGGYIYVGTYYMKDEKLRILIRATQRAGHP